MALKRQPTGAGRKNEIVPDQVLGPGIYQGLPR